MNAQQALQAIPGFAEAKVIRNLAQGITGNTFLVSRAAEDFVLRIRAVEAALFVPDSFAEHHFSGLAYESGLAPEPVFRSVDGHILLRRFSRGAVWSEGTLTGAGLERLASMLECLHQIPVALESSDWAEQALRRYGDQGLAEGRSALSLGERALADIRRYPAVSALCHGDVVCGNIVEQNAALQLIDWEYSRVADPYFDLAVFLVHHELNPVASRILINAYSASVGGLVKGRLKGWVTYYQALQTLWLLALQKKRLIGPLQQARLGKLLAT